MVKVDLKMGDEKDFQEGNFLAVEGRKEWIVKRKNNKIDTQSTHINISYMVTLSFNNNRMFERFYSLASRRLAGVGIHKKSMEKFLVYQPSFI